MYTIWTPQNWRITYPHCQKPSLTHTLKIGSRSTSYSERALLKNAVFQLVTYSILQSAKYFKPSIQRNQALDLEVILERVPFPEWALQWWLGGEGWLRVQDRLGMGVLPTVCYLTLSSLLILVLISWFLSGSGFLRFCPRTVVYILPDFFVCVWLQFGFSLWICLHAL